MKILMTGATGFVGRALCLRLARDGHQLVAVVRDAASARQQLGPEVGVVTWRDEAALGAEVLAADAVVHLAGEPIIGKRWSDAQKGRLRASRIDTAATIARLAASRPTPFAVVLGASAIGYYGDRGDERLTETSARGTDFAAQLCEAWEEAARGIAARRHVITRIGLVMGLGGGMLAKLAPSFRLGLGAALGDGGAWQSWIHLEDLVGLMATALRDEAYTGVYNATAPNPVTNRALSDALARAYGKRARLSAPAFALRLALGEAAGLMLASTRVLPAAAQAQGFAFRFLTIQEAFADLIDPPDGARFEAGGGGGSYSGSGSSSGGSTSSAYLATTRPNRVLVTNTTLDAPLAEVWPFFAAAHNLESITPPELSFRITTPPAAMGEGVLIDYKIKLGPVPMTWRTRIDAWEPGHRFVDCQLRGPYASWHHEHAFEAEGNQTRMIDVVRYRVPFGVLGALAHRLFVGRMLRDIFAFRRQAMRLRFGLA